jgi:hypothetical protein
MLKRDFMRIPILSLIKVIIGLFLFLSKMAFAVTPPTTITRYTATDNPTGMSLGFWANDNKEDLVLNHFGRRQIQRVDFTSWSKLEKSPGVYAWNDSSADPFKNYKRAHSFGSTVVGCINISFSREVTKDKHTIPAFYGSRITDPKTREAAKKFLYAYTQAMLKKVGTMYLSIDYETGWNYRFYDKKNGHNNILEWCAWYQEAAETARKAAADMGMSDQLKLITIFEGDPISHPEVLSDTKCLQALQGLNSDYFGIDSYLCDPSNVTSAQKTIEEVKYWIDHFAGNREVIITEQGFSTVCESETDWKSNKKYAGTEAQQKSYLDSLFTMMDQANRPDGVWKNRVRGFNQWCISDMKVTTKKDNGYESNFGVLHLNGSAKPGLISLQNGYAKFESNDFHRPSNLDQGVPVTAGSAIPLTYTSGTSYQFLRCEFPATAAKGKLVVTLSNPGSVLVQVNQTGWVYSNDMKTLFEGDIQRYLKQDQNTVVDIYCAGENFPVKQEIRSISLE